MNNNIESEIKINAPIEVVWEVITNPEHISKWFAPTELDARLGGKGVVTAHGKTAIEVVKFDKPHVFSYEWSAPDSMGTVSVVEFTLTKEGVGTLLRVTESTDRFKDEKVKSSFAKGHNQGWSGFLPKLASYAQTISVKND